MGGATKHTPKPWEAYKITSNGGWSVRQCGADKNQADITDTFDDSLYMSEADAKLCAAAPELLEALEEMCGLTHSPTAKALAAIAKATAASLTKGY